MLIKVSPPQLASYHRPTSSFRASTICLVLLAWLLLGGPYAVAALTLEVGKSNSAPPFPHTNGRQIARNSDGIWFLAYDAMTEGGASIFLAASRSSQAKRTRQIVEARKLGG